MEASEEIVNDSIDRQVEYEISLRIPKIYFCGANKEEDENENENVNSTNPPTDNELLLIVTWSGQVFKLQQQIEETQPVELNLTLRTTKHECSKKLRTSPVMIKLCRNSKDVGISEVLVSNCFCDSILCEEFSSQTLDQDLKFLNDEGTTTAKSSLTFNIRKIAIDYSAGSETNLDIDEAIAKKFEAQCNTFCENFKVTRNLNRDCRDMLEDFYKYGRF